jgi:hypothetical protein
MRNYSPVVIFLSSAFLLNATVPPAHAGLFSKLKNIAKKPLEQLEKYVEKEVVPTLTGDRPLNIDPTRFTINHNGEKIFEVDAANDTAYVKFGDVVTVQTGKLKQRLAEAGAIWAGDYQVLSKVAAEQFQKQLEEAGAEVSYIPPSDNPVGEIPTGVQRPERNGEIVHTNARAVVIFNGTGGGLNYVLNNKVFRVESGMYVEHRSSSGDFYLQFDQGGEENELSVGRFFLEKSDLYYFTVEGDKILIKSA